MASTADMRFESKLWLQDPIDGTGTDLRVDVAFVGIVLVPQDENRGFCICRH